MVTYAIKYTEKYQEIPINHALLSKLSILQFKLE